MVVPFLLTDYKMLDTIKVSEFLRNLNKFQAEFLRIMLYDIFKR